MPPARPTSTAPTRPEPSVPPRSDAADAAPITAVQPAKPVAARPVVRPAEVRETDGPPCPACGTPNRPGRKFCRRCAAPLDAPEPVAPLPWWRTRWPFRRRVRGGSGRLFRALVTLAVLAALAIGALFLLPAGRSLFEDTRDKLSGATAVSPSRVTASAEVPGHPAGSATDGLNNRYWGAPAVGDSLTFTFRAPFRLVDLVVTSGASTDPQVYRSEARPIALDLVTTTSKGQVTHKSITLNDKPGPQTVPTGISDVVTVQLVVRSAAGTGPGRHIALAEVEFFRRD
ncbi:zinc ribbon domain-containing protein [Streptomyces sp. NPDC094147]|uniref:zinc ribbon domain-containing protein n=1 Tax=Streptomyces sp. NPDC094147 TaxID=3366057 RepID=UPI0038146AEA